jgi:tetratricopeptide (TPR) repeat protein
VFLLMPSRCRLVILLAVSPVGCGAGGPAPAAARKPDPPAKAGRADGKAVERPAAPAAAPVAALVRKGLDAERAGDARGAIRLFEQALAGDPTNREALGRLARLIEQQARELPRPLPYPLYLRAAELTRRLRATFPKLNADEREYLPVIFYNEASALALDGEAARAVGALAEAIDAGFLNLDYIEQDPDFDPIRRFPEFQLLLRRLETGLLLRRIVMEKAYRLDFRLRDLEGKAVTPADFKGKILIATIFGTWNLPGRKEIPHLVTLSRGMKGKDVAVVAIAFESDPEAQAREDLRKFAKDNDLKFPILIGDEALLDRILGFDGFPTTLVLDRKGTVRLTLAGYQPLSTLELAALALLGETHPQKTGTTAAPAKPEPRKETSKKAQ